MVSRVRVEVLIDQADAQALKRWVEQRDTTVTVLFRRVARIAKSDPALAQQIYAALLSGQMPSTGTSVARGRVREQEKEFTPSPTELGHWARKLTAIHSARFGCRNWRVEVTTAEHIEQLYVDIYDAEWDHVESWEHDGIFSVMECERIMLSTEEGLRTFAALLAPFAALKLAEEANEARMSMKEYFKRTLFPMGPGKMEVWFQPIFAPWQGMMENGMGSLAARRMPNSAWAKFKNFTGPWAPDDYANLMQYMRRALMMAIDEIWAEPLGIRIYNSKEGDA